MSNNKSVSGESKVENSMNITSQVENTNLEGNGPRVESREPVKTKPETPENTKPLVESPISPQANEPVEKPRQSVAEPPKEAEDNIIKTEPQVTSNITSDISKDDEFNPASLEELEGIVGKNT